ncbi:hypothetical protein ACFPVX_18745 [Cohnella faecalis]|uniref:Uncharacterized protein n=1 Tax=Cohnella faecalis TaxID=2315694 RepID=A0A398CFH1_9BACL|nr:hypothetical protein [Cohnella faecalis]RIE01165.1 hypothetical protein D3H35_22440 [Cohnella faecalis]
MGLLYNYCQSIQNNKDHGIEREHLGPSGETEPSLSLLALMSRPIGSDKMVSDYDAPAKKS